MSLDINKHITNKRERDYKRSLFYVILKTNTNKIYLFKIKGNNMLKLKVELEDGVKEYGIPNGWDEVSVIKYKELVALRNTKSSNLELYIKIITVISDMEEEEVEQISTTDFEDIVEALKFTQDIIEAPKKEKKSISVDGEKYYLKKDFDKLTLGEQASIEIILNKYDGKLEDAITDLLCIFLRKKKENGKLEKFKNSFMERADSFNNIMIGDVHNMFIFFSNGKK